MEFTRSISLAAYCGFSLVLACSANAADRSETFESVQCWLPDRSDNRDFILDLKDAGQSYDFLYTDKDVTDVIQLGHVTARPSGKRTVHRIYVMRDNTKVWCSGVLK